MVQQHIDDLEVLSAGDSLREKCGSLKHGALRNVVLGMARAEGREPLEMIWIVNPREVFRETSRIS